MRRMLTVAAGVIVMVAAVPAVASAAAPEYGRCMKVETGGSFSDPGCIKGVAGGKYEWLPGPGPTPGFTQVLSGSSMKIESVGGTAITCSGYSASGQVEDPERVQLSLMTFTGCHLPTGAPCTQGPTAGDIEIFGLQGKLGVLKKGVEPSKNKIGLVLFHFDDEATCGAQAFALTGEPIVQVKTDKMLALETQKFVEKHGVQKFVEFEGGETHLLELQFEQAGVQLTLKQTNEAPFEVNAVV